MPEGDLVRVRHVLDAAREAVGFIQGRSRQDLDGDRMLNLSLVRLLEIVGEAARGVLAFLRRWASRCRMEAHGRHAGPSYPRVP